MNVIELTAANIEQHLDGCLEVQKYLVSSEEDIDPEQMKRTAEADCNYFIAIVEGDRVAGLGVINKIVHPVRTNAYVDNIVVHPDFRGRGFFSVLMDALEAKAKEWGAEKTKLTCSREQVQPLYEKRDYSERVDTKYYTKTL